ncbi:hypothetical protein MMC13_001801 [Lambiella insularis]|nr:hypothetical protein [Lambiella insularis]
MTNLTWGHGVASRGLLRGLSLPVASNKKVPPVETEYTRKKTSGPSKSNAAVQPTTPSTNIIPPDSQSLPNLAKRNKDQRTAPQANPKKSLGRHSLEPPHATDLPMQEFHAIDMTTSGLGEYTHFEAKLTKGQNTESNDVTHLNEQLGDGEVSFSTELSLSIPSLSIGKTPRLRFLIKHYENVISPIIVAFDGPTNPYRTHILRLANESDALQNAIAAFSASKIRRMREYNSSTATQPRMALADTPYDKAVQQFSVANTTRDDDFQYTADTKAHPRVPSREELYYKRESIRTLNAQLADPSQRKDDSILATILILCFYDICSAGVAKFKTQFAGVKKILALRGTMSKEVAWLMTMFTWFDAMAATVNDREGQFQDSTSTATYLFPFPPSIPEWTLENLAGCDGRLFSTIARLGRLNLLSLGESVANSLNATPKPQLTVRSTQYYSMNYAHFDGNDLSSLLSNPSSFPTLPLADPHAQFWSEWQTISSSLHSWSLDLTTLPPSFYSCHRLSSDLNRLDLLHISQSFRYAALLYIERLAYPSLPSSASNFQYLVQQGLYYIAQVKSDVNLFWPLFITGTECVEERHRGVIKGRCLSIQRDSGFFNKILGLELLERAWREADMETGAEKLEGKAFRWREAMGVMDGELIVV